MERGRMFSKYSDFDWGYIHGALVLPSSILVQIGTSLSVMSVYYIFETICLSHLDTLSETPMGSLSLREALCSMAAHRLIRLFDGHPAMVPSGQPKHIKAQPEDDPAGVGGVERVE